MQSTLSNDPKKLQLIQRKERHLHRLFKYTLHSTFHFLTILLKYSLSIFIIIFSSSPQNTYTQRSLDNLIKPMAKLAKPATQYPDWPPKINEEGKVTTALEIERDVGT